MEGSAKGAWLLGFVVLEGAGGLDMRFVGGKWRKKKQIPFGDDNQKGKNNSRFAF
jgi:hypothetical protein